MSGFIDIGLFRGLVTVVLFVCFCLVVIWAYSSGRKADFEAAAQLPLEEGDSVNFDDRNGKHRD